MRIAAYIRVSRVGGRVGPSFIATVDQREKIEGYCALYGYEIVGWWEDLDQSGGKMERPHFDEMMHLVEAGQVDGVIVSKLDRFARTVAGAYDAIKRLEAHGAQLVSVAEQLDTSNPYGKFGRTMMLAMAELERDRIIESWATAREHAVGRGVHISTRPPTGYTKPGKGAILVPNADAAAVQEAFRLRAAGASQREVAEMLNARGVTGAYASAGWSPAAVQRLLTNKVYLGEARSGDYVNTDAHPPLITPEEYAAAAERRGLQPLRSADGFLLAGLVRCAGCRYRMTGTKGSKAGRPSWRYRCKRHHPAGTCLDSATISSISLDTYIVERFEEAIQPGGMIFEAHPPTDDIEAAQDRLKAAEAELAAFLETAALAAGPVAYNAALKPRITTRDDALAALSAARANTAPLLDPVSAAEVWEESSTPERREILSAAIDAVYIRKRSVAGRSFGARVHIYWRGTAPTDVPHTGKPAEKVRPLIWPE